MDVPRGTLVRVHRMDGRMEVGRLVEASQDSLKLARSCREKDCSDRLAAEATGVELRDLYSMEYSIGRQTVNGFLIGASLGVLFGLVMARAAPEGEIVSGAVVLISRVVLPLGAIGAGIGALTYKWAPVYIR